MSTDFRELAVKQDQIVQSVIGQKELTGFSKAYAVSTAIGQIQSLLTDEYMEPIMKLQGIKLGFRTDKDMKKVNGSWVKGDGYPVEIVRNCLIEAVFQGLQPYGNQFNIIGGNMYPTKEGLEFRLNTWDGLKYSITPAIPHVNKERTSAVLESTIKWEINGESNEEVVKIPLKIDSYTSIDAMIGKGKRKACAILLSRITGESVVDGDVTDIPNIPFENQQLIEEPKEDNREEFTPEMFEQAKANGADIETIEKAYKVSDEVKQQYIDFDGAAK